MARSQQPLSPPPPPPVCIRHLSATYSGVWRGPSSPCFRRIDIKSYPLDLLPFAVTYFGSCSNFNRALRSGYLFIGGQLGL